MLYRASSQAPVAAHHLLPLIAAIALMFALYPLANHLLRDDGHGFAAERMAPGFELFDAGGERVSLAQFRGRHVYLMFGFLRCDRVCHTQAAVLAELGGLIDADKVHFLYLAMDSRHDQPSMLRKYFDQRGHNFTSLHATELRRMQSLAAAYNAPYRIDGNPTSASYSIDHPARIFLIGPEGQLQRVYGGTVGAADLAADFYRPDPNPES